MIKIKSLISETTLLFHRNITKDVGTRVFVCFGVQNPQCTEPIFTLMFLKLYPFLGEFRQIEKAVFNLRTRCCFISSPTRGVTIVSSL